MGIWNILIIFVCLASAQNASDVTHEYLESLRISNRDEEFARLLGVDVKLVRPDSEQRSEGSRMNLASPYGDMLFYEEQERQGLNFKSYPSYKWPNGRIYYKIVESDFTPIQVDKIKGALSELSSKVKNIIIKESDEETPYYIQIFSGNGCWSFVGCVQKSPQALSLQKDGCLSTGTIQHEFLHALGMTHEHNREDRDKYVTVLWGNISDTWESQYKKVKPPKYSNVLRYDYDSIMHYDMRSPDNPRVDAFSLPVGIDRKRLGQDVCVSPMDIQKLNYMYR